MEELAFGDSTMVKGKEHLLLIIGSDVDGRPYYLPFESEHFSGVPRSDDSIVDDVVAEYPLYDGIRYALPGIRGRVVLTESNLDVLQA